MTQHPYTPMANRGARALRRGTGQDYEPGLEALNWGSILGGAGLVAYGLARRRLSGLFVAGIGAALAYRGLNNSRVVDRSIKQLTLHTGATEPVELAGSMTIDRPVDEVYGYWRDFENLPRVLRHVRSVQTMDGDRVRWEARLPGDVELEWNARLLEDRENELIAWQSVEGTDIYNEGYVAFHPVFDGEATELNVRIVYRPPAGEIGARIAQFFDRLQQQFIREDLRSFKQLMEAGEIPTTHGQPSARPGRTNGRFDRLQ